jgi:pimeloyl-ACP methyl ester carboxylesterase
MLAPATRLPAAQAAAGRPDGFCGEVIAIETHGGTTTRYALSSAPGEGARDTRIALVLLVGGGGNINLDAKGCPRALSRNVLMRMLALFREAGFATALVDAPSDSASGDGLAEFRITPQHAADLGKVIVDLRTRTNSAIWLLGHSRGTISAANAAARLSGSAAVDGLVLLSAMMSGDARARKPLARQSLFELPLEAIKAPVLTIGHGADNCERSPAGLMEKITAGTQGIREQAITLTGGPIKPGRPANLAACEVGEPHDFVEQEAEVAAGIIRFIGGGSF